MKEPNYTPAPWYAEGEIVKSSDGVLIAGVFDGTLDDWEDPVAIRANAALIAAAPEMLELLQALCTEILNGGVELKSVSPRRLDILINKAVPK